jgi:hypothetical protein
MNATERSLCRVADSLHGIALDLDRMNRRMTKYLDGLEPSLTESDIRRQSDVLKLEITGPPSVFCGFCFREINYRGNEKLIECEHARLCAACAPCDQCE